MSKCNIYKDAYRVRRAFTLIELLVVIAIIAVLMGVLMPSLNKAKEKARLSICAGRMKHIGIATMMYVQDNKDYFPKSSHSASVSGCLRWGPALMPYLDCGVYSGSDSPAWKNLFNGFYRCPADRRQNSAWSYGKNVWFELTPSETGEVFGRRAGATYWKFIHTPRPGGTVQFGELGEKLMMSAADHVMSHFWLMGGEPEIDATRHGKVSNYIFADGHVHSQPLEGTFSLDKKIDNWNPGTAR